MLRRRATGRNIAFSFAVVVLLWLFMILVLYPAYRTVSSGFDPMDVQYPLSLAMVAFQRGAFGPGIQLAYLQVATVDFLFAVAYAICLALSWSWMAERAESPFIERSIARGLMFFPFILAAVDWAENICFLMLVFANPRDPQHELTATTLAVHNVKHFAVLVNELVTLTIAGAAGLSWLQRKGRPRKA